MPQQTRFWLALAAAVVALILHARAASAQAAPAAEPDRPLEIMTFAAVGRSATNWEPLLQPANRDHVVVGVHITARVAGQHRFTISYAPEFVPLMLVSNVPDDRLVTISSPDGPKTVVAGGYRHAAGIGLSPIGFEERLCLTSRFRLNSSLAAGFVMFNRPTPNVDTRRFNYTFQVGAGMDVLVHPGWWLRVAYAFHHFSNAFTVIDNPGVNANLLVIGLSHAIGKS